MYRKKQMDWDRVAPSWVQHIKEAPGDEGDFVRKYVLNSVLFSLMGEVTTKTAIDVGCGEGYLTRMIARAGAKAAGLDISPIMLAEAKRRERAAPLGIEYVNAAIEDPPASLNGLFDLAVSNLVFNILADHEAAFAAIARMLKPAGTMVISIVHPGFDDVGPGWVTTGDGETRWSENRYFERVNGVSASGAPSFHRCLSDYISAALASGTVLTGFKEPIFAGRLERSFPPDRRSYARIPYFAVLRFEKR